MSVQTSEAADPRGVAELMRIDRPRHGLLSSVFG